MKDFTGVTESDQGGEGSSLQKALVCSLNVAGVTAQSLVS